MGCYMISNPNRQLWLRKISRSSSPIADPGYRISENHKVVTNVNRKAQAPGEEMHTPYGVHPYLIPHQQRVIFATYPSPPKGAPFIVKQGCLRFKVNFLLQMLYGVTGACVALQIRRWRLPSFEDVPVVEVVGSPAA